MSKDVVSDGGSVASVESDDGDLDDLDGVIDAGCVDSDSDDGVGSRDKEFSIKPIYSNICSSTGFLSQWPYPPATKAFSARPLAA